MSAMLEKAARAAERAAGGEIAAETARDIVRAVLTSIREPDEVMREAARDWSYEKYGKPVGYEGTDGCFQAQIDAILREPKS